MLYHLFIISSLDRPIYRSVHCIRKKLLRKYGISYSALVNHSEPRSTSSTFSPMAFDEVLYPGDVRNPHMTYKFLNAVKILFHATIPTYIVRINATTYVHFPALDALLKSPTFPKTKVLAGYQLSWGINGMIMIFSSDVLVNILNDPRVFQKHILEQPDDVALSILARPYSQFVDLTPNFYNIYPNPSTHDQNGLLRLVDIPENKWLFRIRDERHPDRRTDIHNWARILS